MLRLSAHEVDDVVLGYQVWKENRLEPRVLACLAACRSAGRFRVSRLAIRSANLVRVSFFEGGLRSVSRVSSVDSVDRPPYEMYARKPSRLT